MAGKLKDEQNLAVSKILELKTMVEGLFLLNSKCALKINEKRYLLKLMNNKAPNTTLLYRGSDHGWSYKDFHNRCDNKGPTLCLFRVKDGDCIGGYTSAQWSSDGNKLVGDKDAMVFNITIGRHFPSKNTGIDIFCSSGRGPCFSGGNGSELCALDAPFNGEGKC